jgi:uncharacterized membrane-anchored protein
VTRPLGASFADWLGVSHARGGLDWGTGGVSIGTSIIIVAVVAYLALLAPSRATTADRSSASG